MACAIDPVNCPVGPVLEFLQERLTAGAAATTLRVYVAAIAARRELDEIPLGRHRMVSAFMRGVRWLRPAHPTAVPSWDFSVVHEGLVTAPFESIESAPERILTLLLWHSTEAVAFFTPRPRPYFPCLLSVSSHLLRDSLCTALQTGKIMDLINWSLNAIDTIFSTRSLGSREPDCIYLFGTIITGLLLIGLGFALGYRRIQKTGTAVQSLTRLPVMIGAVGRAVSIETETINRNMDSIMEKLTALQRKIDGIGDQNGQRE